MNNSQRLSQDIIYDINFSNKISISNENSITDSLINEIFISEENINQHNSSSTILSECCEDKLYVIITGIFSSAILLICILIFIKYI